MPSRSIGVKEVKFTGLELRKPSLEFANVQCTWVYIAYIIGGCCCVTTLAKLEKHTMSDMLSELWPTVPPEPETTKKSVF